MRVFIGVLVSVVLLSGAQGQWTRVEGVPGRDVGAVCVVGEMVFVGTDSAVYVSVDGGAVWARSTTLPYSPKLVDALFYSNGKIYAGTGGNGVFVSSDMGETWQELNAGLTGLGSRFIGSFAQLHGVLYAATIGGGVFRLDGNAWVRFGDLDGNTAGNVEFLGVKGDTLVAGAGGNGYVWYSPNGALPWRPVLVAPLESEPLIVTSVVSFNGELYAGSTYRVFRSSDNGATWESAGDGLPGNRFITLLPSGGTMFSVSTSTISRIHRWESNGTWSFLEGTTLVYEAVLYNDKILAGRLDGLWFRTLTTTPVAETPRVPVEIVLKQNYPNPFNPSTTIAFSIPDRDITTLKVYNLLGEEVALLLHQELPAGEHNVTFEAKGLSSGVYFYRLQSGSQILTRQLVLVR